MAITKFLSAAVPALLMLQGTQALPNIVPPEEGHIEGRQCTGCGPIIPHEHYCPVMDSEEAFTGEPWQAAGTYSAAQTVTFGKTYAVGSSWTVGGGLGVSFEKVIGLSAAFGGEISQSVETSVSTGAEDVCPPPATGGYRCSLLVYEGYVRIKGHNKRMMAGETCPAGVVGKEGQWEAVVPRKDKAGNGHYRTELCNCCELAGYSNPGHVEKCCVDACVA